MHATAIFKHAVMAGLIPVIACLLVGCPADTSGSDDAGTVLDTADLASMGDSSVRLPVSHGVFVGTANGTERLMDTRTRCTVSEEPIVIEYKLQHTAEERFLVNGYEVGPRRIVSVPGTCGLPTTDFEYSSLSIVANEVRLVGNLTCTHDDGNSWTGPFVLSFSWIDEDHVDFYYEMRTTWVQDPAYEKLETGNARLARVATD